APGYAARYRDRIGNAFRQAVNEGDRSAAQKAIDILKDHQFLLPQDQMAYVRARCCEVLGEQRTASLFYREAWRFNPEDPNYLSSYLESLCQEGRHAEARAIVEEEITNHPGVQSSVNAMHVINAILVRSRQSGGIEDQRQVEQPRIDLLQHFEAALEAYRSQMPAERQ